MNSEFLRFYLETELYLQNPPMHMGNFIDFCKKRGIKIDKSKLEYLEKKNCFILYLEQLIFIILFQNSL